MMTTKILFIGGGNMTKAIVSGLVHQKYSPKKIYVVDHNADKRDFFAQQSIHVSAVITDFIEHAEIIILAVKPQGAKDVCLSFKHLMTPNQLILSVMAGITTQTLQQWFEQPLAIVRAMPNTPASIQCGATGLFANSQTSTAQKIDVELIMKAIGIIAWVNHEELLAAINALSGSGPAYYFYFIEIMQQLGAELGLPAELSKEFALQTAYGAARLALESKEDIAQLRAQVASKGGTTAAAIAMMTQKDLTATLRAGLAACYERAIELSKMAEN